MFMKLVKYDKSKCILVIEKEKLDLFGITPKELTNAEYSSKKKDILIESVKNICSDHICVEEYLYIIIAQNEHEDFAFIAIGDMEEDEVMEMMENDDSNSIEEILNACNFIDSYEDDSDSLIKTYIKVHFNNMSSAIEFCKRIASIPLNTSIFISENKGYSLITEYNLTIEHLAGEFMHYYSNIEKLPSEYITNNAVVLLSKIGC